MVPSVKNGLDGHSEREVKTSEFGTAVEVVDEDCVGVGDGEVIAVVGNGAVLNIIDGISPVSVGQSFKGDHIYLEGVFKADHQKNACGMQLDTSLALESLLPSPNVNAIISFDQVFAHPSTTMQFFEFLLTDFQDFGFSFGSRRQVTDADIDEVRL